MTIDEESIISNLSLMSGNFGEQYDELPSFIHDRSANPPQMAFNLTKKDTKKKYSLFPSPPSSSLEPNFLASKPPPNLSSSSNSYNSSDISSRQQRQQQQQQQQHYSINSHDFSSPSTFSTSWKSKDSPTQGQGGSGKEVKFKENINIIPSHFNIPENKNNLSTSNSHPSDSSHLLSENILLPSSSSFIPSSLHQHSLPTTINQSLSDIKSIKSNDTYKDMENLSKKNDSQSYHTLHSIMDMKNISDFDLSLDIESINQSRKNSPVHFRPKTNNEILPSHQVEKNSSMKSGHLDDFFDGDDEGDLNFDSEEINLMEHLKEESNLSESNLPPHHRHHQISDISFEKNKEVSKPNESIKAAKSMLDNDSNNFKGAKKKSSVLLSIQKDFPRRRIKEMKDNYSYEQDIMDLENQLEEDINSQSEDLLEKDSYPSLKYRTSSSKDRVEALNSILKKEIQETQNLAIKLWKDKEEFEKYKNRELDRIKSSVGGEKESRTIIEELKSEIDRLQKKIVENDENYKMVLDRYVKENSRLKAAQNRITNVSNKKVDASIVPESSVGGSSPSQVPKEMKRGSDFLASGSSKSVVHSLMKISDYLFHIPNIHDYVTERILPQGQRERIYSNGIKITFYENGSAKEQIPSNKHIPVSASEFSKTETLVTDDLIDPSIAGHTFYYFTNGHKKELFPNGDVIYTYAPSGIQCKVDAKNGIRTYLYPSGQVEKYYGLNMMLNDVEKRTAGFNNLDMSVYHEIIYPDGTVHKKMNNATEVITYTDGTVVHIDANGKRTLTLQHGPSHWINPGLTTEIHVKRNDQERSEGQNQTMNEGG